MELELLLAGLVFALAGLGLWVRRRNRWRKTRAEALFPPRGRFVEVQGHRVHAEIAGAGPDVVLIHGASGNTRDFTFDLVARLTAHYRVIAFDRPGLGYSDRLGDAGASPGEQADALAAAARRLGVRKAVIVGHSFGGAVALAWALDHPESAAAVVSLAGAVNPWKGGLGAWYEIVSTRLGGATVLPLVAAFAPVSKAEAVIASIFEPQAAPEGYAASVGVGLMMRPETARANARQLARLKPELAKMVRRYGEIHVPVEILHGTADTIVPIDAHSAPLLSQIASARLTPLAGVGHMLHHANPEAVVAAIDRAATRAGLR